MKYEQIIEMIKSKGSVAQYIFNCYMECVDSKTCIEYGLDKIATFAVNYTRLLLKLIIEKPDLYKEMLDIKQDEFERAVLDYETIFSQIETKCRLISPIGLTVIVISYLLFL